jgi:voltage-gated potassium channel Kch
LYRHQVKADIAPYQMLFIGLFFLALGMTLDMPILKDNFVIVISGALGLILLKFIAIYIASRFHHASHRHAAITGLLLAQGGEFGLLILQTIKTSGIDAIPLPHQDIIKGIILLSMIITPILLSVMYSLNGRGVLYSKRLAEKINDSMPKKPAVMIAGFGRVGKTIAKTLTDRGIDYVAIDMDVDEVETGRRAGFNVVYGDTTRSEIWINFGLSPRTTRAVVIALNNAYAQKKAIRAVKRIAKNMKIFARAKNLTDSKELTAEGARLALPETIESSFLLATEVMHTLGITEDGINKVLNDLRKNNYETMESLES